MNGIKYIGWFSNLRHGRPESPELSEVLHALPHDQAEQIAAYLERGTVIAETTGAILRDEVNPLHPDIGPFRTLTDGEYIWPSDLAYYVRHYGASVGLGLEAKAAEVPIRPLSAHEIDYVVDLMLG